MINITEPEVATKPTVENELDNDKTNVTKDVESNNDKATVAEANESDNDTKMITTKSGSTQQFYCESFARVLVGEIIITFLANHFF